MFDINNVGKKISELRMKQGLTQSQLADKLYVSYQAVSNWERGLSMPDVGKLKELANALNSDIEEIIGQNKESKIFNVVLEDNYDDEEVKTFDVDSLCNAAPFLKHETVELVLKKLDKNIFEIRHAVNMAPFISSESICYILENIDKGPIDISFLIELAPFVKQKTLDELIKKHKIENSDKLVLTSSLAPFLSSESLKFLLKDVSCVEEVMELVELAPFVDQDLLYKLASKLKKVSSFKDLIHLAPFLSSEQFDEIIQNAANKK